MAGAPHNRPTKAYVRGIAELEAWRHGVSVESVLGPGLNRTSVKARHKAWLTILDETGCSMNGLSVVWGCDRQAIRRTMIAHSQSQMVPRVIHRPIDQMAD